MYACVSVMHHLTNNTYINTQNVYFTELLTDYHHNNNS